MSRLPQTVALACLSSVLLTQASQITPPEATSSVSWPAAHDVQLAVLPGSVLDFSGFRALKPIAEADTLTIDAQGQFKVASTGERRRFLIAALGWGNITGGMPPEAEIDATIEQVVRRGYNMVRLDFVEDMLMNQREKDFDPDPTQLKRLHYTFHKLRQAGVYAILNLLSGGNGGYGDIPERWRDRHQLGQKLYHDPQAREHWRKMVLSFYGVRNPYTGVSLLQDPTLAGVALANESGINMVARQGAPEGIARQYEAWLSTAPGVSKGGGPLSEWLRNDAAWQQFIVEREGELAKALSQPLREAGFKGAITAYNNWLSPAASYSRGQLDWVDLHNYAGEPDRWTARGSRRKPPDIVSAAGGYLMDLAISRHWSKPYTVSEYGQVFWDPKRFQHVLLGPAVGALQDWQGLCQHSRAIELRYWARGVAPQIRPFMAGLDPISRANEVMAALLYGRGDVRTSPNRIDLQLTPEFALKQAGPLWGMPQPWRQLGLITGIGLSTPGQPFQGKAALTVKLRPGPQAGTPDAPNLAQSVAALQRTGALPKGNRTDVAKGVYQSDTGELLVDTGASLFTLNTPRTQGLTFGAAPTAPLTGLPHLQVLQASTGATVALAAVDTQPVASSQRLLLVIATDARNSGQRFQDARGEVLDELGELPVRIQPIRLSLQLQLKPGNWQAYAVAMNGQRRDALPLQATPQGLRLDIDTDQLPQGPALYVELVPRQP